MSIEQIAGVFPERIAADQWDGVDRAVAEIAAGRPVVVVDETPTDSTARLVIAADAATPLWMAFVIRHTAGVVRVAMPAESLDRLGVPLMAADDGMRRESSFAVSVDASEGISTGISAADRSRTIQILADPTSIPDDLIRPGHVIPVRTAPGGVCSRAGDAEAALDLTCLADRRPAAVVAELVEDTGPLLSGNGCRAFADRHGLAMISVAQLVTHLRRRSGLTDEQAGAARAGRAVLTAVGSPR